MMNAANPYLQQYKKSQVETATPEQLLILLYDGAIQFLNKAKNAVENGDIGQCTSNLFSAQKIILEFMNTLDMENGGDLAQSLYGLYGYLYKTLVKANISQDLQKIDEVLTFLSNLRDTWQKAIVIAAAERASEEAEYSENAHTEDEEEDYEEEEVDEDDEDAESKGVLG